MRWLRIRRRCVFGAVCEVLKYDMDEKPKWNCSV
jgi:hypothetical protein